MHPPRGVALRSPAAVLALPAGLVALVVAPLLWPGYVLSYDMVFVPRQPFTAAMFGLGGSVPRAVPSDFAVALASRLLPADLVQKAVLAGILLAAGYGVARLLRDAPPAARVAAAAYYVWNAYVYERLVLGHWALLLGYAALPWAVHGALGVRTGRPAALRTTGLALAAAAIGGFAAGVIVAGVTALVVCWPGAGHRSRRRVPGGLPGALPSGLRGRLRGRARWRAPGLVLGAAAVLNAPWLVPSLLRPSGVPSDPAGVGAFAARADTALGTLGSLLTLGGGWNAEVAPPGRGSVAVAIALLALLAVAATGLPRLSGYLGRDGARALATTAAGGLLVAAAPALPGVAAAFEFVVLHAPGGGMLRDSQKYVLPLALLQALGFGLGAALVAGAARQRPVRVLATALAVLAPVAVLPALALGAAGRLKPVQYPGDWARARAVVAADEVPGAVAVLPWRLYREFGWNDGRPTLDPAPRFFDRPVVVDDALRLADRTVRGEDPWARLLDPVLAAPAAAGQSAAGQSAAGQSAAGQSATAPADSVVAALRERHVRYVLVERTQPGAVEAERRLAGAERVLDGSELALYRLPEPAGAEPAGAPLLPVLIADVAAALLFLSLLFVPYRMYPHATDNSSVEFSGVRD